MSRIQVWLNVVLTAGCVFLGVLLLQQRKVSAALQDTVASQKRAIIASDAREAARRKKADDAAQARVARREALAKAAAANGKPGAAKSARDASGSVDLGPYMRRDPGYAELRHLQLLRQVARDYPNLAKLNLPPDQLARLQELLVERAEAPDDARAVSEEQGLDPNSRDARRAMQAATADVDSDITQLIGQDANQQLQQMRSTSQFRTQLQYMVGQDLTAQGVGLSSSQMDTLASAAAQAMKNYKGSDWQGTFSQAVTQASQGVLTPEQSAVFQSSMDYNAKMSAVQQRAMAAARVDFGQVNSYHWSN